MKKIKGKIFIVALTSSVLFSAVGCDSSSFSESKPQDGKNLAKKGVNPNEDAQEILNSYRKELRGNNVKIGTKESLDIFDSVIANHNQGQEVVLTKAMKEHVNSLGKELAKSASPEEAYKILDVNYAKIANSKIFSSSEKEILFNINESIRLSTQFLIKEFNENGLNVLQKGKKKKSLWDCICEEYDELTDTISGQVIVAIAPGPAVVAIIVGGTVRYYTRNKNNTVII